MPVIPKSQLGNFVRDSLLAVRNGCQGAVEDGFVVLWPETVQFACVVVEDNEAMVAVNRQKAAPEAAQTTVTRTEAEEEKSVKEGTRESTERMTGTATASETDESSGSESVRDEVTQEQAFGRSSSTQVTYLRS